MDRIVFTLPRFCNRECESGVMGRTRNCKAVTNSQLSHALVIFPRCDSDHCRYAALDILIGGGPTGHANSHRRMPLPLRSPTPAGPIVLDLCDYPPRLLRTAERDQHLVQDHVVQDGESRPVQTFRKHFRLARSFARSSPATRCVPVSASLPTTRPRAPAATLPAHSGRARAHRSVVR